jgi:hypothetical protein
MREMQNLPIFRPDVGLASVATDPMSTSAFPHFWFDGTTVKLVSADAVATSIGGGFAGSGRPALNRGAIPSSRIPFSVNPTANDTLTLGGAVIKFVASLGAAVAQTQVKIGASAAATLAIVVKAVNGIADAANITDGTTPLTAANVGAAVVGDSPTATSFRILLATARGGTALAGVSASVALSASITSGGAWDHANLNETGKAETDVSEAAGKVTITTAMVTAMGAAGVFIELPFAPTVVDAQFVTSAGAQKNTVTDTVTISGNALVLTSAGATHLANTDVVYFWAVA